MQYTIRNLPERLDRAVRERARSENKSLNEVTVEALLRAFGLLGNGHLPLQRDLTGIAGSWVDDPEQSAVLEEQRRIDPDLWR